MKLRNNLTPIALDVLLMVIIQKWFIIAINVRSDFIYNVLIIIILKWTRDYYAQNVIVDKIILYLNLLAFIVNNEIK